MFRVDIVNPNHGYPAISFEDGMNESEKIVFNLLPDELRGLSNLSNSRT